MKKLFFTLNLIAYSVPVLAFAEGNPISVLISGDMNGCSGDCVPNLLNGLFMAGLSAGAMLAVLRIGYAGWLYMGSADMWSSKHHAIEVFQNAIIGLLLLLGIWLILFQINPEILNLDFTRSINGAAGSAPGAPGTTQTDRFGTTMNL